MRVSCGLHRGNIFSIGTTIEEGWKQKLRQRSLRLFDLVQFLAALRFERKRKNSTVSFKSTEVKQLAQQGIEQIVPQRP